MRDFSTAADCTARLGLGPADLDQLKGLMAAASQMMVDFMNRDPRLNDYTDKLNGGGLVTLPLRQYPIVSVLQVTIGGQVLTADQFTFDDYTLVRRGMPWPKGHRNIQVMYSAGLDPAPKTLREAHLMTVTALWLGKDKNPNATGESWAGVSSESWQPDGPGSLPPSARSLLKQYFNPVVIP